MAAAVPQPAPRIAEVIIYLSPSGFALYETPRRSRSSAAIQPPHPELLLLWQTIGPVHTGTRTDEPIRVRN
jgi:hypothetical protein